MSSGPQMEAAAPKLVTATTAVYLIAREWIPHKPGEPSVHVPGGKVAAFPAAANLLHCALWNLQRQGAIAFEQLRPVEKETVTVFGGQSFTRFEMLKPEAKIRGLEGALMNASRELAEPESWLQRKLREFVDEDEQGLRGLVYALALDDRTPWTTVTNKCYTEANNAGLVQSKGFVINIRVEVTDPEAVESQRPYAEAVRAARRAAMDADPHLHQAIISDCLSAVAGARAGPQ